MEELVNSPWFWVIAAPVGLFAGAFFFLLGADLAIRASFLAEDLFDWVRYKLKEPTRLTPPIYYATINELNTVENDCNRRFSDTMEDHDLLARRIRDIDERLRLFEALDLVEKENQAFLKKGSRPKKAKKR
jgi:hypothetical protein